MDIQTETEQPAAPAATPAWVGVERIRRYVAKDGKVSPLGEQVAIFLDELYYGLHHVDGRALSRVEWSHPSWMAITLYGTLSTTDFNDLTRLVLLAHRMALRVEVEAATHGYLRLCFSPRSRDGGTWARHPTIQEAIASFEQHTTVPEVR